MEEESFGRTFTPADRIIGQIRHVQYHAGMAYAQVEGIAHEARRLPHLCMKMIENESKLKADS